VKTIPFVDLNPIHTPIREELNRAIQAVLDEGDFIKGKAVTRFEENFAGYIGTRYAVGCANGTDALELALEALDLKPDDEVIVPVHSWISTATAVLRAGAKVVFADTLYDEFTINPNSIKEKITAKTKAIMVVHLYGNPCRMDEIMQIAKENKLIVIEDCAQAHGAKYKGKRVGSFGVMSCFSFYPSKNLGAFGDGGAVLSDDKNLIEKIRAIAHCGQVEKNKIDYIGRNSRLDSIQAAVLDVKLNYLDGWNESRRAAALDYSKLLKGYDLVLPTITKGCEHVYHLFVVKAKNRNDFSQMLDINKIGHAIHYPFLLNEINGLRDGLEYPIADRYKGEILSMPMYAGIEKEGKSLLDFLSLSS
jgi:dTDP-4-amino-4,6-dideoxygalactose transaminase